MKNIEISKYLNDLSSTSYTPGGGSAICAVANIAISLLLKSINITMARKSFNDLKDNEKENYSNVKLFLETCVERFYILADEDEKAFDSFMKAYKAKEDLKAVYINCFDVPFKTFNQLVEVYDQCKYIKVVDSIVSDYKIGCNLILECMHSCLETMNVNVNGYKELQEKHSKCFEKFVERSYR